MEPQRCTVGIWVMAAFLGAAAIVLDNPPLFLASFSLVSFSAALAIRFRVRMHRIVTAAAITRSADRTVMQQGGCAAITTAFSTRPDPGVVIRITDLLPPAVLSDPPDTSAVAAADGSATIRYVLTPRVPGSIRFFGILLSLSDPYFAASVVMGTGPFRGPGLEVSPHAAYERSRTRHETGEQEKNIPSPLRGYEVRAIREYVRGDDLRSIDWKMTAKYDRMFIREYTAVINVPPLVVLDLPDRSFLVPEERIARLVNAAAAETASAIRNYGSVSLLLLSGVNIIDIVLAETDLPRCIRILRTSAHPQFRLHHAYRWKSRAVMRGFIRKTGSGNPGTSPAGFFNRIARVYQKSLANPYSPVFSTQVRRLLTSLQMKEIVLYSLFEGDSSHVRELALQAQAQRIRLVPRTLAGQDAAAIAAIGNMPGIDTPEVIP